MSFVAQWAGVTWRLLADAAPYVILGLLVGGLLKVFLSPALVARHLGRGRFASVFKASLLGIPMPLCSCAVLPAAAALKRQGANNGATTAFLISTPETGVDSIAISWALLGPVMTVARPVAAFATAVVAGVAENLASWSGDQRPAVADLSCPVDRCCDGVDCDAEVHGRHHTRREKIAAGLRFAFGELWGELATWFAIGMVVAGLIGAVVPDDAMSTYLGGGLTSMLVMLAVGIPLYICATASTPIAAMLILKGASPGAALVFLLAGPATNVASLSVVLRVLGKRATVIYLASIAVVSVACGLALDAVFAWLGLSAVAQVGQASEIVPEWLRTVSAGVLVAISIRPVSAAVMNLLRRRGGHAGHDHDGHDHDGHDHDGHDHDDGEACREPGDVSPPPCSSPTCSCAAPRPPKRR
jgi:hypothetical protein